MNIKQEATRRTDVFHLDPRLIHVEEGFNARLDQDHNDILESIRVKGVKMPLHTFTKNDTIYVKDGHRRLAAVMQLINEGENIRSVPCVHAPKSETVEERTFDLLTCNSGKPLSKLEQGHVFIRLVNFGYKQAEIAHEVGKSVAHVNQAIALAKSPKKVQELILTGKVGESLVLEVLQKTEDGDEAYNILMKSLEEASQNGGTRREVVRAAQSQIGKVSLPKQMKALSEWIEENSMVFKDHSGYLAVVAAVEFLQGKGPIEELSVIIGKDEE